MANLDMRPAFPSSNLIDRASIKTVFDSHGWPIFLRFLAYFLNNGFAYLTRSRLFTASFGSMAHGIIRIFLFGTPPEVRKGIIRSNPVPMATFMVSRRSWSHKGLKNHYVNCSHLCLAFKRKIYRLIPSKACERTDALFNDPRSSTFGVNLSLNVSNAAKITNFVRELVSNNRAPLFLHVQSPITKAPWIGVWRQHGKLMFRSYPSHTKRLYA